jgi:hypothetical protein
MGRRRRHAKLLSTATLILEPIPERLPAIRMIGGTVTILLGLATMHHLHPAIIARTTLDHRQVGLLFLLLQCHHRTIRRDRGRGDDPATTLRTVELVGDGVDTLMSHLREACLARDDPGFRFAIAARRRGRIGRRRIGRRCVGRRRIARTHTSGSRLVTQLAHATQQHRRLARHSLLSRQRAARSRTLLSRRAHSRHGGVRAGAHIERPELMTVHARSLFPGGERRGRIVGILRSSTSRRLRTDEPVQMPRVGGPIKPSSGCQVVRRRSGRG